MSASPNSYGRNSPHATARVLATLIAQDARIDWRELEFLGDAGLLQMLGIDREHFTALLFDCLEERCFNQTTTDAGARGARFDAALDAIDDRGMQLVTAAALLYLAEIDGALPAERTLIRRAWARWRVTPEVLIQEMNIPHALARMPSEPVLQSS